MILYGKVKVEKGIIPEINAVLEEDASCFIEKSKSSQVVQNISFPETVEAPIEKGAVIGEATYSVDNTVVKKVNIVASDSSKKITFINMTTDLYNRWFKLLR